MLFFHGENISHSDVQKVHPQIWQNMAATRPHFIIGCFAKNNNCKIQFPLFLPCFRGLMQAKNCPGPFEKQWIFCMIEDFREYSILRRPLVPVCMRGAVFSKNRKKEEVYRQ